MFQMSVGQKYRRTNFDDEETVGGLGGGAGGGSSGGAGEGLASPGVIYDPVIAFRARGSGFCKRRSTLEKLASLVVCLLITVIVTLLVLLSSHRGEEDMERHVTPPKGGMSQEQPATSTAGGNNNEKSASPWSNLCLSKGCVTVASTILNSMDDTVDPCVDFYQYACGGWITSHPIPPGESRWDTFGVLRKENQVVLKHLLESPYNQSTQSGAELKARVYYTSCVDVNKTIDGLGAEPLISLIRSFGGWAMTNSSGLFDVSSWKFEQTLQSLHSLGLFNFFNLWVSDDEKEPTRNILQLDQGGISLQREQYINKTIATDTILTSYLTFMTEVGVLLGGERNMTSQLMTDVIEFEQKIANINWKRYLNKILSEVTSYSIDDTEPIVVKAPDFISQISRLVTDMMTTTHGNITLHNYMIWHLAKSLCSCLSKPFQDAKKSFFRSVYGTTGDEEQWRYCVADTESMLGFAVGAMFVRETFNSGSKKSAEEMIDYIKAAFKSNLPKLTWMDTETIKAAMEKADAVVNMIGFPEYILNKTLLDERYSEMSVSSDAYFQNNLNSMKYVMKRNVDKLRKAPDKTSWNMAPSAVNAYYTPTKNQIVFPAGILQAPYFDKDFPHSLNFGAMGVVMGHELTHGFDDQGREYDKDGVLSPWWNQASVERFKKRTQCMIDQYSQYSAYGENVRGKQTLGENIADNGGVKSAYYAYNRWLDENGAERLLPGLNLTHQQLFFLSFAQVWCTNSRKEDYHMSIMADSHSPHRFRVIGPLSNSREFSEQFQCPPNSPMNPLDKCEVW